MTELSQLTLCAKYIRKELKAVYPDVKFSVRTRRFSMGNAVDVRYPKSAGIVHEDLRKLLDKYIYADFDGMDDSTTIRPENGLPRAKFVSAYIDHDA